MFEVLFFASFADFDWSITNDLIASASSDCSMQIWNSNTAQNIRVIKDNYACAVNACRFMPLNNNLIVVSFLFICFFRGYGLLEISMVECKC